MTNLPGEYILLAFKMLVNISDRLAGGENIQKACEQGKNKTDFDGKMYLQRWYGPYESSVNM